MWGKHYFEPDPHFTVRPPLIKLSYIGHHAAGSGRKHASGVPVWFSRRTTTDMCMPWCEVVATSGFCRPAPPPTLTVTNVRKADFYETLKQMPRDKEKALEVRSIP